jgi:23S rRNA (cytosine1962-C5)-methyltransferase
MKSKAKTTGSKVPDMAASRTGGGSNEAPGTTAPTLASTEHLRTSPIPMVVVSQRASARLRAGHPWVYSSDVERAIAAPGEAAIPAGSLVQVSDVRGQLLGTALYSSSSMIALRLFASTGIAHRSDFLDLLRERLRAAVERRMDVWKRSSRTDACRLVFGEADELPGIIVDRYGQLAIVQLLTQGTDAEDVRRAVVEVLRETLDPETIVERPDARIRELEELKPPADAPLYMKHPEAPLLASTFHLNGLSFQFDVKAGQKTGAFLDQRENYMAAEAYAHGRALDICTYQGAFALHMGRVCREVIGVDISRAALEVAERNLEVNRAQFVDQGERIEWIEANAFDLLRDWSDAGEQFDTIVLDPPAFAKSKRATEGALRGYKELNLRALKMLRAGGVLVTCSCSHHISLAEFQDVVTAAASDAHRRVCLLETRGASLDHPAILTIPETQYLKCLICMVL